MSCDVGKAAERLENELWPTWIAYDVGEVTGTYVKAHSPTLAPLYLRHSFASFSNPYIASPMSQLIFQPLRCFTYVTAHSSTLLLLHLRHSSFSNPCFTSPTSQLCSFSNFSVTSSTSQLILQPFRRFTYAAHSPTLSLLHLRHSSLSRPCFASPMPQLCSFSNLFVTSPTSQLILQPFRCFTYVTVHSPTLLSLLLRHNLFT